MNAIFFLLAAGAIYFLGIRFYSRRIARNLGEDDSHPTPAVSLNDGVDYVPANRHVVFSHHFCAIAGAGPIVGPTVALLYGFGPAWLWVVIGAVLIGAVHDYTALYTSIREGGKSMAEVARKNLGDAGAALFIIFLLIVTVLLASSFLSLSTKALTSEWELAKLGLKEGKTFLSTVSHHGVLYGRLGGIASTSVIFITLLAPPFGYLIHKGRLTPPVAYFSAGVGCIVSVGVGIHWPLNLEPQHWMIVLSVYTALAAGAPFWLIIQPRDFVNVQILYAGLLLLFSAITMNGVAALLSGEPFVISAPMMNVAAGEQMEGPIWPMLFILIACGAVSGYHAIVAGGTTCKQVEQETDTHRIAYNSMILESFLAVLVLIALAQGLSYVDYLDIVWPKAGGSNPILAFSLGAGTVINKAFGISLPLSCIFGILMVEGFVITTLEATVRLSRYLFEELWGIFFPLLGRETPNFMKFYFFNTTLSVVIMFLLAHLNAFKALWPLFGTANQLVASLSLIAVSVWLLAKGKRFLFTLIPAGFMLVTTVTALVLLLPGHYANGEYVLFVADLLLLGLALAMSGLVVRTFMNFRKKKISGISGTSLNS